MNMINILATVNKCFLLCDNIDHKGIANEATILTDLNIPGTKITKENAVEVLESQTSDDIYIIASQSVLDVVIGKCNRIYLNIIDSDNTKGRLPPIPHSIWVLESHESINGITFQSYARRQNGR